jgi:hypothetical protein
MPITSPKLHRPWIALAALVGALLVSGGSASASACSAMASRGDCAPADCCCESPSADIPAEADIAPPSLHEDASAGTARVRHESPAGRCRCGSRAPAAPRPKAPTTREGRPDPGRGASGDRFDLTPMPRSFTCAGRPSGSPSQKSPVYLRTSRLLI